MFSLAVENVQSFVIDHTICIIFNSKIKLQATPVDVLFTINDNIIEMYRRLIPLNDFRICVIFCFVFFFAHNYNKQNY